LTFHKCCRCTPEFRASDYLAKISDTLKNIKQPDDINIEEIQPHIEEQYALIEDMQRWLDSYLKN
jgi:hypothetical protein